MSNSISLKFKTNINCGGCVKAVTPWLSKAEGIDSWEVDTSHPDKILTIVGDETKKESIVALIQKAGFEIEEI